MANENRNSPTTPTRRSVPSSPVAGSGIDSSTLSGLECGVAELAERLEAGEYVTVVDVRQPEEVANGTLSGALTIPLGELDARWEELKECNEVVCYCATGKRSKSAAMKLRALGIMNATSLEGGVAAWTQYGGELVTG
jgi:rhodanese-related sulfurtransferase